MQGPRPGRRRARPCSAPSPSASGRVPALEVTLFALRRGARDRQGQGPGAGAGGGHRSHRWARRCSSRCSVLGGRDAPAPAGGPRPARRPVLRLLKSPLRILGGVLVLVLLYVGVHLRPGVVDLAPRHTAHRPRPSWSWARPSGTASRRPVLKARLDHAVELYQDGRAPLIIVTGGKQPGDRVTQGFAGYDYLQARGVPEEAIKVEVDGRQQLRGAVGGGRDRAPGQGRPDVVLISDPYHSLRISQIAEEVGLRPHVSPADTPSPCGRSSGRRPRSRSGASSVTDGWQRSPRVFSPCGAHLRGWCNWQHSRF